MSGLSQTTDGSSQNSGEAPEEKSVTGELSESARYDTNECPHIHKMFVSHISTYSDLECQTRSFKIVSLTQTLLEFVWSFFVR